MSIPQRSCFFRKAYLGLLAFLASACSNQAVPLPEEEEPFFFVQGADVSFLPELRYSGVITRFQEQPEDPLLTLQRSGVNVIRLRLWKQPTEATSAFSTVKKLSSEVKNLGFKT
ncbi:MAG TPA: glycosyl hydrolase 53 family protein, partial [Rhodothermales bacterium]|nr:glycosyl hydrolase 53 family protein [Rhodothermales bacterium]